MGLSTMLGAALLAGLNAMPFLSSPSRGVAVTGLETLDFGAAELRSYRFYGYLPKMPDAVRTAFADRVCPNRKEPRYTSCRLTESVSCRRLPSSIRLDTSGWPVGDYSLAFSCCVMEGGKDRYPVSPVRFALRDDVRETAPATPFAVADDVLGIPLVRGHGGDPAGAADVAIPWQTGFAVVGKGVAASEQTRFKAFHDNDWLYVAVVCDEPVLANVAALKAWGHDNVMIAREEGIEINLDPTGKGAGFYKIVVRPTGDFADYACEDDNTGTDRYVSDSLWESGARIVTRLGARHWTVEAAIPLGPLSSLWTAAGADWGLSVGRTRFSGRRPTWSIWPVAAKGFCKPKTFARARLQGLAADGHSWTLALEKGATRAAGGALAFGVKATLVNRSRDFRFATVTATLEDVNRRRLGSRSTRLLDASPDRLVPVELELADVPRGNATLRLEVRSAEGRLETQLARDVRVAYDPVAIRLTEPCYRDCIFDSQNLTEVAGEVRLAEGVGQPLEIRLVGPGTDERQTIDKACAANAFRFPFRDKAKGTYFVKAGPASRRIRNLPFRDGEIWVDRDGVMRRNGEKFLPYGWFSDPLTETYPGITISQMYASHFTTGEAIRACLDRCARHRRGFILRPQQMLGTDGKFLFDTKGEQGAFTDEQRAEIGRFADVVQDHPWFLAYYLCDEPEGRDLNPEWFRSVRDFLAEKDPYHPTMMLNYSIAGVRRYASAGAEINCPDAYPYYFTDGTTREPRRVTYDKAKAAATSGANSAWVTPQLFDWPTAEPGKVSCAPTFDAIREQALLALAGDARGFLWYTRFSYGGAFTEHLRHGPRLLLDELLETRDVFLSPTREGLMAVSNGPDKTLVAALKTFGDETLVIAVNTSDRAVEAAFSGAALPAKVYPNGTSAPIAVVGGRFSDRLGRFEAKVYYDREKRFDLARQRAYVYGLEASRRRAGNLAAAPRILTYGELAKAAKGLPDDWYPRFVASSSEAQGAALPYPYFLQDGLVDEWPITPYLAWKPLETDRRPWVRCEFGKTCRFSKVVVSRCRDEAGRIRLLAGRLVANGRELASFDAERGCRLELTFPAVEADSVTLELVRRDGTSQCRDLSEIEVY